MRNKLLNINEVDKWFCLFSNYKIEIKYMGEYRMGSEWCEILLIDPLNKEYINFGNLAFPNINHENNFYLITEWEEYMILDWMFFKRQTQSTPVFINLKNKTFKLIDTSRLIYPKKIAIINQEIIAEFKENIWINSKLTEKEISLKLSTADMKPIEEFYSLNEDSMHAPIFKWNEGQLEITFD